MNCHDFQTRLAAAIEAHGPSEPERMRLQQHVTQCSDDDCHQLWDDHELLARLVPRWTPDVPRVSLADRVLTSLRSSDVGHLVPLSTREQQPSGLQSVPHHTGSATASPVPGRPSSDHLNLTGRQARWLPLSAAVASLLLLIPVLRLSETPSPEPVVQSEPSLEQSADDGPGVAQSAQEPIAVSEMIRTFAGVPQSASRLMSETIVFLDGGTEADHPAPQPSGYSPWQGRLSEQWEPWGRELGTAFDAFLKSLSEPPPPKSSQRKSMIGQQAPVTA